jgi:hypothetical protein
MGFNDAVILVLSTALVSFSAIWLHNFIGKKFAEAMETVRTFSAYVKADSERADKLNILLGKIAEECANTRKAAEIVRDTVTNAVAGTVPGVDPQVQRYQAMVEGWRQQGRDQTEAERLAAEAFMKEIEGQF